MADPYAVLGIDRTATDEEVHAAYRARSMLLHPDLHQGRPQHVRVEAERAMTQLTEAYETVRRRRAAGRAARGGGAGAAGGGRAAGARSGPAGRSPFYRLGRLASRAGVARAAAEAGEQPGGAAYRLGWLVGRRRAR